MRGVTYLLGYRLTGYCRWLALISDPRDGWIPAAGIRPPVCPLATLGAEPARRVACGIPPSPSSAKVVTTATRGGAAIIFRRTRRPTRYDFPSVPVSGLS